MFLANIANRTYSTGKRRKLQKTNFGRAAVNGRQDVTNHSYRHEAQVLQSKLRQ